MDCPSCGNGLVNKKICDVAIDECVECKGSWFEEDELRRAKDAADSDLKWIDFEIWKNKDLIKPRSKNIACPKCSKALVAIDYGKTNVEIDYCPDCRGVWLDKGEFQSIVEALIKELHTKSYPDYIKASIDEAKEIIDGPESFVSEWKDFITVFRMMQYRLFIGNPKLTATLVAIQEANPLK